MDHNQWIFHLILIRNLILFEWIVKLFCFLYLTSYFCLQLNCLLAYEKHWYYVSNSFPTSVGKIEYYHLSFSLKSIFLSWLKQPMQSNRGMTTFWEIHFRTSVEWTITEVYSLDFTDFPPILNYYCGWNILASASKPTITTIKNERKPSMEPQTKKHISIWFSIICALISQLYSMYAAINIFQSFVYKTLSHQRLSQAPP